MKLPSEANIKKLIQTATGTGTCADSSAMVVCREKAVICCVNTMLEEDDPTAHASIVATRLKRREIRQAKQNAYIIVSERPCPMCMTGIFQTGIRNLFYIENNEAKYLDLNSGTQGFFD